MGDKSKIEWTDCTDNVIIAAQGGWWCHKVKGDDACVNCYAETTNDNSWFGGNHLPYDGKPPELKLRSDIIDRWARMTKPKKHFVMSMSDWAGEWVPRAWQFEMLDGMAAAPLQIFQLLTKRANICLKTVKLWMAARGIVSPPKHIWLGFTAGNQYWFDQRWRFMRELAGMGWVIFVSAEPLSGSLALPEDFLALGRRAQVIVGGESGKNVRPMHPNYPRSLRDQCAKAGVAYFFKQWGEWEIETMSDAHAAMPYEKRFAFDDDQTMVRVGKKTAGRLLDGRTWDEFPV